MEFLSNYGLFLAKTVTLLAALLAVIGFIATLAMRRRTAAPEHIEVKPINDCLLYTSPSPRDRG